MSAFSLCPSHSTVALLLNRSPRSVSEDRYEDGEVIIDKNGMRFVRKPLMRVSLPGPDDDVLSLASTWSDSLTVSEPPSPSSNHSTHGQTTRPGGFGLLPSELGTLVVFLV